MNKVLLLLLTSPNNKIESEMTYNTTATFDKLACTNYVDFGKCQDSFGRVSWSKNSFDYLDVKLRVFKSDENKHPALDIDSVYRPGIDTPFSLSIFGDFQMERSTAANPILVDDEEDNETSAPRTSTPESERPTETPRLLRSRPFGTRRENVPDSVYRTLFR